MSLSQKGARYRNQSELQRKDRILGEALDDIVSKNRAVLIQGNFGEDGPPEPPSTPTALRVTAVNGLFTASVIHNSPPAGTRYILQHSTTPNFPDGNTVTEELGTVESVTTTWQRSLPGQQLYFRVASKFPASKIGPWVYLGSAGKPTLVS
jgi:hypothetical protein